MRENRPYGSEGGALTRPYPYYGALKINPLVNRSLCNFAF